MNENPGLTQNRRLAGLARGLFWGWNAVFLAFVIFGFAPLQLPLMIKSIQDGVTPWIYLFFSVVVIAIPIAATLIGIFFLRKDAYRLFALGYVLEWPLVMILLFRFFLIREGNPAITVLLVWLGIAEAVFLWYLLDRKNYESMPFWRHLRLAGLTLLFAGTIYAAIWLAFYIPPLAVFVYQGLESTVRGLGDILRNITWNRWYELPLATLSYVLFMFSGILILTMPVAAPIVAGRSWLSSLRSAQQTGGRTVSWLTALIPLALVLVVLVVCMQQPQQRAFQLLEKPPATAAEAQALLTRQEEIRAGLVNAYLASFRYLSSEGEVRHISDVYRYTVNASDETAWKIEQAYEVVLRPFLYTPVHPVSQESRDSVTLVTEQQAAADLYQRFFDQPILVGERKQIVDTVRSTSNVNQAELAWQAVDDREVYINRQEVNITEHGDWADVQLYEVYENVTFLRQEVVYYFSLPESAVITGLWLGNSADRSKAFEFHVVPRGAAQALYRNEVRYNRDPALVEQIGPRQYRLRAFPVEPMGWVAGSDDRKPGPKLHLWMTYRTLMVGGSWPLPQLAQKFNVYWNQKSTRLVNGTATTAGDETWLPARIVPTIAAAQTAHRVDFTDGMSVIVRPASEAQAAALPEDLRLAVVLDRSFSMRERTGEVKQALTELKQAAGSGVDPVVYLTASVYRGESAGKTSLASLDPDKVMYFGGQNAAELLAQFEELSAGQAYDLVLVLTDGSGYELGSGNIELAVPNAPMWLVHLGGGFPLGYDDATQQVIQASGGGAAATVAEALARYAISREAPGRIDAVDGYMWEILPTGDAAAQAVDALSGGEANDFAALAVRRLILAEMAKNRGALDELPVLDAIHQMAVSHGIVTPYSSLLVLVNTNQEALLDQLNQRDDRFDREVEGIGQTAAANPFAVTGVPEPEEWLLLILTVCLLIYAFWRNRGKPHLMRNA